MISGNEVPGYNRKPLSSSDDIIGSGLLWPDGVNCNVPLQQQKLVSLLLLLYAPAKTSTSFYEKQEVPIIAFQILQRVWSSEDRDVGAKAQTPIPLCKVGERGAFAGAGRRGPGIRKLCFGSLNGSHLKSH